MKHHPQALALLGVILMVFAGNHLLAITDPVESNYALTAKEMLAAGDFISPRIYGNFWYDKPIFFYWELLAGFQLFGVNEFAARFSRHSFPYSMSCRSGTSRKSSTIRGRPLPRR